jgi:hypothetical protein
MEGKTRVFKRGTDFPHEGFVQSAIERHFGSTGHAPSKEKHSDFACQEPKTGRRWVVEAKGLTTAVGLDFRTGLGQLIQRASDPQLSYGLAVPNIPSFLAQCRAVSAWVREALHIHWLVVSEDGSVRVIGPDETL